MIDQSLVNQFFTEEHFGYFQYLTITNNAVVNNCTKVLSME